MTTVPNFPIKGGTAALWNHQRKALLRSRNKAAFAFDFDPGLGKTATVIAEAGQFFLEGEIDTLIIDAPNRVHQQWVLKAFPQWATFPWKGFAWPRGGIKSERRRAQFEAALKLSKVQPRLRVFAFNFENVRQPHGTKRKPAAVPPVLKLLQRIFDTSEKGVYFVVDESHRIKDHQSQQTRAAHAFGKGHSKVRRKLTGTPILQGVQDLWSQYAFLDPLIIGEPTFYSFRAKYCKTRTIPRTNVTIIEGSKNVDELMNRIAPYTARVKKEDAQDMPPKVFDKFLVEMEHEQERAYLQMEELMMTGLKAGQKIITAKIVLTQLQKLLQIASGFLYDEGKEVHWLSDGKVEAIRTKVEDLGGAHCVVWAPYIPLLDRLCEAMPDATRFRQLSDIDVWGKKGGPLVANPASGGVGVDGMHKFAHRAFYAANAFHLEYRIQSIDRLHRGDQKKTCFYTDFLSIGTKDFQVVDALDAKEDVGNMTAEKLREILMRPSLTP